MPVPVPVGIPGRVQELDERATPHPTARRPSSWWALTAISFAVLGFALLPIVPSTARLGRLSVPVLQTLWPVMLALGLLVIVIGVRRRHTVACVLAACAAFAALVPINHWRPAGCADGETPTGNLSVLTANAYVASADLQALSTVVLDRDVDLLVVPEATNDFVAQFSETTGGRRLTHRTRVTRDDGFSGTAVLSRLPIEQIGGATGGSARHTFDQPAVRLIVAGLPVTVQAVHPYPPVEEVRSWDASLRELGRWQRASTDEHLVLAGDFNASWAHPAFRDAVGGLHDAGPSWGPFDRPTWPVGGRLPSFVTIDHIMVRGFESTDAAAIDVPGSDHRAVWSNLRLCHSNAKPAT